MRSLLIATNNALVLWSDWTERVVHGKAGMYYGITWSPDTLYAVARENKPSRMIAFDMSSGELVPMHPPPFTQMGTGYDGPHQVLWFDGRLYVTNTQYNRVEVWDELTGAIGCIHFEPPVGRKDVDHVNSIWREHETGYYYVAEHRKALMPKRIRVMGGSGRLHKTIHLDLPSLNAGPSHRGMHNVFVKDRRLYTLSASTIIIHDLDGGDTTERSIEGVIEGQHYLRGLAVTPEVFLVGSSIASERKKRGWGGSTVHILDHKLRKIDQIYLSKRWGQVTEIRVLDGEDLAHGNRVVFPEDVLCAMCS